MNNILATRQYMRECCKSAEAEIMKVAHNIRLKGGGGELYGPGHHHYDSFMLVAHALTEYLPEHGMMLEFGVASGNSATLTGGILKNTGTNRTLYGFDTFTGLPEVWKGFKKGTYAYSKDGALPPVPRNVQLLKGLFDDTLPPFLAERKDPSETVAFANIDCDLYKGAIFVLKALQPRLCPGTLLHFHELNQIPPADELNALYNFMKKWPNFKLEL